MGSNPLIMDLYKHQKDFLATGIKKSLLCHSTGTGKTRTAIEWAKKQYATKIIVICPRGLRENWKREILKYDGNNFNPWEIHSKEEFRRDWDKISKAEVVIVDEAHYFAGMKSQMSKSLLKYNKKWKTQNILLLTATAYTSSPWSVYMLAKQLGYHINYMDFKETFFYDQYFGRRIVSVPLPNTEKTIAELVEKIGDIVHISECVDVPEQLLIREDFELTPKQKKAKKNIEEINPIVRFTKHSQIENGTLKSDGYTKDEFFPSYKIDRVKELCLENKKVAVICRYNLQIDLLNDILKDTKKPIHIIRGDVKDRDSVIRQAEKDKECIVLINAAVCEGYELSSINFIIFASLSWSYVSYKQMLGRFLRINNLTKNVYVHLVSEGVDEAVYQAIQNKKSFDVAIYNKGVVE